MRRHLLLFFFLASGSALYAQQDSLFQDFQTMRRELLQEFYHFREEANKEYATFLGQAWEEFAFIQGKPLFEKPKLPEPIMAGKENQPIKNNQLQMQELVGKMPDPPELPEMKSQLETSDLYTGKTFNCSFYGAALTLRYQIEDISLPSIEEQAVSRLWITFAQSKFSSLLLDMLHYKEQMQMNDWAYFLLTKEIARNISALKDERSRLVFQFFLLVQSGYDVRLTRIDHFLALLVPIHEVVYSCPSLKIDEKKYYIFADRKLDQYTSVFSYRLPERAKGNKLSLQMNRPLLLPKQGKSFTINAAGISVKSEVNINKMKFYQDYPQCHFLIHARTLPDKDFRQSVISSLSQQFVDNDSTTMLNKLLLWVQTGFKYQTDLQQFGYENPFFIEENFYYPYNDCEDRSILFSYLVKQLLGFEVVLLEYSNHIATAVRLNKSVEGDYININRAKYIICDPTYLYSTAGRLMPKYKEEKPKVFRIE